MHCELCHSGPRELGYRLCEPCLEAIARLWRVANGEVSSVSYIAPTCGSRKDANVAKATKDTGKAADTVGKDTLHATDKVGKASTDTVRKPHALIGSSEEERAQRTKEKVDAQQYLHCGTPDIGVPFGVFLRVLCAAVVQQLLRPTGGVDFDRRN